LEVAVHIVMPAAGRAAVLAAACSAAAVPALGQSPEEAWAAVDRAIGRAGSLQPGEVQKYSFPRADLRVTVAGVGIKPAL